MPNPYEEAARKRKAALIAQRLTSQRIPPVVAAGLSKAERDFVALQAGAKSAPSDACWDLVVATMEGRPAPVTGGKAPKMKVRRPWADMDMVARKISADLPDGLEHHWCGSYRRRSALVGDLDLVVVATKPLSMLGLPGYLGPAEGFVQLRAKVNLCGVPDVQVDVWLADPLERGPFLVHATGPAELNIAMRAMALRYGWCLSQFGLRDAANKRVDEPEGGESSVFEALGYPYLTAEQRSAWRLHVSGNGTPPSGRTERTR